MQLYCTAVQPISHDVKDFDPNQFNAAEFARQMLPSHEWGIILQIYMIVCSAREILRILAEVTSTARQLNSYFVEEQSRDIGWSVSQVLAKLQDFLRALQSKMQVHGFGTDNSAQDMIKKLGGSLLHSSDFGGGKSFLGDRKLNLKSR